MERLYTEYHPVITKQFVFLIVAHSCGWQLTFDEMYSALADCIVFGSSSTVGAVRKCAWADGAAGTEPCAGRPGTRWWQRRRRSPSAATAVNGPGSSAGPRPSLGALGAPRSPPRWRRALAALRLVCSAAPALAPRSPCPRRPLCAWLVCSAVASALTPRSPRVRRPLCAWCVALAVATRRHPRTWLCQLPGSADAADEGGRMGEGGASDGRGGWRRTLSDARSRAGGEAPV